MVKSTNIGATMSQSLTHAMFAKKSNKAKTTLQKTARIKKLLKNARFS